MKQSRHSQEGFTLIEITIALAITSIIVLMTWKGLNFSIRATEVIELNKNKTNSYSDLIKQFELDCQNIVKDETLDFIPAITTPQYLALLRSNSNNKGGYWEIIRYDVINGNLKRSNSIPITNKKILNAMWKTLSQKDANSTDPTTSYDWLDIRNQTIRLFLSSNRNKTIQGIEASWQINNQIYPLNVTCLTGAN